MKCQYLGQATKLSGRTKTAMNQYMNWLAQRQMKAVIRIVGAGTQASDIQRDVSRRQAAWRNLIEGRIRGWAGGATTEQQHGDDSNGDSHGRPIIGCIA